MVPRPQQEKHEAEALFVTVVPRPPRVMDTRRAKAPSGAGVLAAAQRFLPRRFLPQRKWMLTGAAAVLSLLLLGVILSFRTPHGTVTIRYRGPRSDSLHRWRRVHNQATEESAAS